MGVGMLQARAAVHELGSKMVCIQGQIHCGPRLVQWSLHCAGLVMQLLRVWTAEALPDR